MGWGFDGAVRGGLSAAHENEWVPRQYLVRTRDMCGKTRAVRHRPARPSPSCSNVAAQASKERDSGESVGRIKPAPSLIGYVAKVGIDTRRAVVQ